MVASALFTGCASSGPPRDFDLRRAAIIQSSDNPDAPHRGPSGAATGAGRGALMGVGVGLVAGSAACLVTGPWFPACLALMVPASTAVGTAGGAAVGAIKAESREASAAKEALLRQSAAAVSYQQVLTEQLQRQAEDRLSIALPLVDANDAASTTDTVRPWTIAVGVDEIAADSNGEDRPFGIRVGAHVALRRPGATTVVYKMDYGVTSEASMTTAQWGANASEAVQTAIDRNLQRVAEMILKGLLGEPIASPSQRRSP